jgi:hypothetical protein
MRHVGNSTNPRVYSLHNCVPESGYEVRAPDVSWTDFVLTRAG